MALLLVFIAQPIVNYSAVLATHFAHNMQEPAQDNFRKTLAKMTVADLGPGSTSTRRDQQTLGLSNKGISIHYDFMSLRMNHSFKLSISIQLAKVSSY